MKCDELKSLWVYSRDINENCDEEFVNFAKENGYEELVEKKEVTEAIAELKDKCQMHDFFWEGCGFEKRGFKNTIAVSEAFDRLEAENAELKKKLMPCLNGDCILTCEVVEKYGKENAELKAKLEDVKASHYAEMVDAGMRERRLKRALYKTCANWADVVAFVETQGIGYDNSIAEKWRKMESKCIKKAEEYK